MVPRSSVRRVTRAIRLAAFTGMALAVGVVAACDRAPHPERSDTNAVTAVTAQGTPITKPMVTPAVTRNTGAAAMPSAAAPSLSLLGHADLGGVGFNANVRAHNRFAYVGSWGGARCPAMGVRVVDLADPAHPTVVAIAAQLPGTTAEDVVPVRLSTPAFTGDLLAVGIQRCSGVPAAAGLALVDVSDPRRPVDLAFFDTGARGVHELDVLVRDGRALALLAVPYGERDGHGDFQIVEVTDPRHPVLRSSWGIGAALGIGDRDGVGCTRAVYDHSVRASRDGRRAYLSYWDAGVVIMDISDPVAPVLVGRAVDPDAEGAVHSVDETPSGLLLVTAEDEVFSTPRGLRLEAATDGDRITVAGCQSRFGVDLDRAGTVEGTLSDLGDGCSGGISGPVALVNGSDACTVTEQARQARAAGARALLVIEAGRDPTSLSVGQSPSGLPVIGIGAEDGARLRAMSARGATVRLPSAHPWGGVTIWDVRDPRAPVRVGDFHSASSLRFPPAAPGYFTAHNPLSDGRIAFVSWYSDGVRVVDLTDPGRPREIASFVPPPTPDPQRSFPEAPLVWGVARADGLVLVSDVNSGLWVLRPAGLANTP